MLLSEYMYYLKEGGVLYTITDVEDLANWHRSQLEEHPGFELLSEEELKDDPVVDAVYHSTEEGKKVERNHGKKYLYAARRKRDGECVESVLWSVCVRYQETMIDIRSIGQASITDTLLSQHYHKEKDDQAKHKRGGIHERRNCIMR